MSINNEYKNKMLIGRCPNQICSLRTVDCVLKKYDKLGIEEASGNDFNVCQACGTDLKIDLVDRD